MIGKRIALASIIMLAPHWLFAQEPTILKHEGWVAAVAFSPDGKTLASAGADKVVRLWEVGTWKPKGVLKGHSDCVCAVSFSQDGGWLATGSFDGTAKVWSAPHFEEPWTSKKQRGAVTSVLAHDLSGSAFLWMGSVDGTVQWILPPGLTKSFFQHKSWVNGLAFNENAGLAGASSDGTVFCPTPEKKNVKSFSPVILEGGAGEVRCVAFSPNGKMLAAGNRLGTVRIWNVASKKEIKTITGHMGEVWSIAFSPDGKTLAAVDTEWKKPSQVKLYDTANWKERGALPCPGEILSIAYSPRGDWLAAGCWDKTVRVFPNATRER
jgi:WD40 repeat protein